MNKALGFLLLAMVCMGAKCGCSGDDPCENAPACESVELGTLKLDPASSGALPFQGQETVTFINTQGAKLNLTAGRFEDYPAAKYRTKLLDGCSDCSEYYQPEGRMLKFKSINPEFTVVYALLKNVPEQFNGPSNFDPTKVGDVVAIEMNYSERFAISLNSSEVEINAYRALKLHDSLLVGAKTYRKVYEVYYPYSEIPTSVKGIYYTKADGLVGFYYGNNEKWYKKS